jgi:hypothetical protein
MQSRKPNKQGRIWDALFAQMRAALAQCGTEDHFGKGDYLVVDDNYGWRRHKIEIHRLEILTPEIVGRLRRLLKGLPDWEIVIALDIPGTEDRWPLMGVTIREREIIDGLQRSYLPPEFEGMSFEGARPGSGWD